MEGFDFEVMDAHSFNQAGLITLDTLFDALVDLDTESAVAAAAMIEFYRKSNNDHQLIEGADFAVTDVAVLTLMISDLVGDYADALRLSDSPYQAN